MENINNSESANLLKDVIDKNKRPRTGCKDVWNAFMVREATFIHPSDMPLCPNTAKEIPTALIGYNDAKTIYNKEIKAGHRNLHINAFIHFYINDEKFDGKESSVWLFPKKAFRIIKHFEGIITPDFSTNVDFPDPIKRNNTYRMRAFGYWIGIQGKKVFNNVRWGTAETYSYCFDGIPVGETVCIGSVASEIRKLKNRSLFEDGLKKMVKV